MTRRGLVARLIRTFATDISPRPLPPLAGVIRQAGPRQSWTPLLYTPSLRHGKCGSPSQQECAVRPHGAVVSSPAPTCAARCWPHGATLTDLAADWQSARPSNLP